MTEHSRRERRRPRYNHCDSPIIAAVQALSRHYHCTFRVCRDSIDIRHNGITVRLGTFDEIKAMTVRGLIGFFEELTQEWRRGIEDTGNDKE